MISWWRRQRLVPVESSIIIKLTASVLGLILLVPLIIVLGLAINGSRYLSFPPTELSLRWLSEVWNSQVWRNAFRQSLTVAMFAAPLATFLATCAALAIRHLRFARAVQTFMLLPLIVPLIVTALAIYPVFLQLRLLGTTTGLVLGHTVIALPFAFLTVWGSISVLDPQFERAAESLGANWFRRLTKVTIPLILPAIFASTIVSAAVSFDEIVISLFVAEPKTRTVPVLLWSHLRENLGPTLAAASLFIAVINVTIMAAAIAAGKRAMKTRSTVS